QRRLHRVGAGVVRLHDLGDPVRALVGALRLHTVVALLLDAVIDGEGGAAVGEAPADPAADAHDDEDRHRDQGDDEAPARLAGRLRWLIVPTRVRWAARTTWSSRHGPPGLRLAVRLRVSAVVPWTGPVGRRRVRRRAVPSWSLASVPTLGRRLSKVALRRPVLPTRW